MSGPFETEAEARAEALWTTHGREQRMSIESANVAQLAAACSGIELGSHDRRIIEWLAGYEPSTVAVICGLITRARERQAEPEGGKLAAIRAVLAEFDWSRGDIADLQGLLERIEQIAGSSRTASGIEPGGSASLLPADVATVLGALADAADLLEHRAGQWCDGCNASPAGACDDHAGDLTYAAAYRSLAAKLGSAS